MRATQLSIPYCNFVDKRAQRVHIVFEAEAVVIHMELRKSRLPKTRFRSQASPYLFRTDDGYMWKLEFGVQGKVEEPCLLADEMTRTPRQRSSMLASESMARTMLKGSQAYCPLSWAGCEGIFFYLLAFLATRLPA